MIKTCCFWSQKTRNQTKSRKKNFFFDKLTTVFWSQISFQKQLDFTKLKGEVELQFLQLYKPGTTKYVDGFKDAIKGKENEYGNFFLESIRFSLLKMKALGLVKINFQNQNKQYNIYELLKNLEIKTFYENLNDDKGSAKQTLLRFAFLTFSPDPNYSKNVLNKAINKVWTPWLHILQRAAGFDPIWIGANLKEINVSSLANSKVQVASALSLQQIQSLKKLQLLVEKRELNWVLQKNPPKPQNFGLESLEIQIQARIQPLDIISLFSKNRKTRKVSTYLLWLPIFNIKEIKLSQNKIFPVNALATAIQNMLNTETFDFINLKDEAQKQFFNLLNAQGQIKEEKTFQDDVWRQIKNSSKWKAVEGSLGQLILQFAIRSLLFKIQDLGIEKVSHPFFLNDYDLGFLQDNESWKEISFKNLLEGMTVKFNGGDVKFYSHLFPNKIVFQVPIKKLSTVFSEITITNIVKTLEKAISDYVPQKERYIKSTVPWSGSGFVIVIFLLFLSFFMGLFYYLFRFKK